MQSTASFRTLYEEHYGFVWATVCRFGVGPMSAEDAVHDTFIVAYRRRSAFDGQSPRSWLYSIGRRVASNYRRTRGRRESRHAAAAELVIPAADLESDVGAKVSLDRFLATLSAEDRELFVLSELDGLTGPELAAALGRKLPTVYGRVRVLRKRFQHAVVAQEETLRAAKRDRPRAKAGGWLLLQPALSASSAVWGSKLVTAGALIAASLVVIGVATSQDSPSVPPASPQAQVAPAAAVGKPAAPTEPAAQAPAPPQPDAKTLRSPDGPGPRSQPKPRTVRKARTRASASPTPAPEPAYDLAADTKLLQSANRALRNGWPKRALELLSEHDRRFPKTALPDGRTALWVDALCADDRPAEAKRRADALRAARPNSPMLPRIDATCASKENDAKQP